MFECAGGSGEAASAERRVVGETKRAKTNVEFPLLIQAGHKGQVYKVKMLNLGGNIRYGGQVFDSPSGAARAIAME